jgi:hypothetical protein
MASKNKNQGARRRADSGRPEEGSGKGRRDVTGVMPDDVRIDPDITEGHPGYEESGESEILPPPAEGERGT